jgi:hypothetical protein
MAWLVTTVDDHTAIVDTIDDFFPYSLITPGVLGLQCKVVHHGSQCT